ncbi:Transcriptional regulator, HxlR family [plant metagenome]|uniref:Transcriptional regulator, HxlR family n=3 Tax=root TaxID=1 RepID=A0A1C3K4W2_9BURK|nr:helix-turn-helix domain-containing protein [Orrella dioscoreae]SBT26546.1 Transcriptional regulator, HxlR family [Orrella dioscoreae]SOE46893.1 Transcriptional regulator, HxlR family [Orrella dioscoreae]
MIPQATPEFDALMRQSQQACDALSDDDDGLKREILSHAGNRWSLGVVHALGVGGTLRHAEIARRLEGVTQRMLTRTLRQLERDGLISRHDFREVPPRVEYRLTELGRGLLTGMLPLWQWVIAHAEGLRSARRRYDAEQG